MRPPQSRGKNRRGTARPCRVTVSYRPLYRGAPCWSPVEYEERDMTVTRGQVVALDGVKPVKWAGETGRWLLRGEQTGGLYSFFEVTTPPGGGPPLHIHQDV